MKTYFIYMLASKRNGTLYIGMTNDMIRRVYEHKSGLIEGFTKKYSINKLVYFESTTDLNEAILREKRLKKWKRRWKVELIEKKIPSGETCLKTFNINYWIPTFAGMTILFIPDRTIVLVIPALTGVRQA